MLRKIPIAATPINLKELLSSLKNIFKKERPQKEFIKYLSLFLNAEYLFLLNSGLASFFIISGVLKKKSNRKEIVLPAYTASSLILAIKKANLKPILCDISLEDLNMDLAMLEDLVSKDTLAILGIHMFGIIADGLSNLKERFPDVFIIEDCAQSLGSKLNGVSVGNLGDISFFSFNRGKNLPTYGGGCIAINSTELAKEIIQEVNKVEAISLKEKLIIALKIFGLSLAIRPFIYGLGYPFISQFKDVTPIEDFEVKQYTDFQAKVALSILRRIEELSKKRYHNGMRLIEGLKDIDGIILPKINEDTEPAFNRLPVLFKDLKKREKIEKALWKAGFETSRMYLKPLHHIFDLGYKKEDFPNAVYFAEHLLTLPVHPLVREDDLLKMIDIIKDKSRV